MNITLEDNKVIIDWVTYIKDNQTKQSKRGDIVHYYDYHWDIFSRATNVRLCRSFCYPTEQEAIKARDKAIALYKIKSYAEEKWWEFIPDWKNYDQHKHYISYEHKPEAYPIYSTRYSQDMGVIYLKEEEHWEEIIKKFAPELNILFDIV